MTTETAIVPYTPRAVVAPGDVVQLVSEAQRLHTHAIVVELVAGGVVVRWHGQRWIARGAWSELRGPVHAPVLAVEVFEPWQVAAPQPRRRRARARRAPTA